jgi:hypothetical protein
MRAGLEASHGARAPSRQGLLRRALALDVHATCARTYSYALLKADGNNG